MKGMLVKDIQLLSQQRRFFILLFLTAAFLAYTVGESASLGYLTSLFFALALGTISYDEFDNGFSFLMTLPMERRTYVREKYVFGILITAAGWIIGVIFSWVFAFVKGEAIDVSEGFYTILVCYIFLCFFALMIPFMLKFGTEKGKLMGLLLAGIVFVIGYLAISRWDTDKIIHSAASFYLGAGKFIVPAVTAAVLYISYLFSAVIFDKKEF